jgi:hypothetical protein
MPAYELLFGIPNRTSDNSGHDGYWIAQYKLEGSIMPPIRCLNSISGDVYLDRLTPLSMQHRCDLAVEDHCT